MPGYPTHLFIQRRIAEAAKRGLGPSGDAARMMINHPDVAAMGSIGPDLTFFLDLQFDAQLWVQRGIHVYHAFENFAKPYNDAVEWLKTNVDKAATAAVPGYEPVRDAFKQFQDTFTLIADTFMTAMETFATGYIDGFAYLKLPMQQGVREESWFWFDMVHYRRTSQFAHNLFRQAGRDGKLQAFAAGYATHLAADTAGHSYVNACAGGPYRTQWQRHHCSDNYIDVWTLDHYEGKDINGSGLFTEYPTEMDPAIRQQFIAALHDTYTDIRHPNGDLMGKREWPEDDDIVRMWEMMLEAIKVQTSATVISAPKPPDHPIDFGSFPSPPDYGGDADGGRRQVGFSWAALFESILICIKETVEFIRDVVKWVVDTLVATALWPFQYALYLIQQACYQMYRACRRVLALRGYCFAHPDELVGGSKITNTAAGTLAGAVLVGTSDLHFDLEQGYYIVGNRMDPSYPHREGAVSSPKLLADAANWMAQVDSKAKILIQACLTAGGFPQAFQTPWRYPTTPGEPENTPNGPYEDGSLPDMFIEKAVFDRDLYQTLKTIRNADGMVAFSAKASKSWQSCLGNAVDLGRAMLDDIAGPGGAPDFNLDGDRGYGWLCWDVKPLRAKTRRTDDFPVSELVFGADVGRR